MDYLIEAIAEDRIQVRRAEANAWRLRRVAGARRDAEGRGTGGERRRPITTRLLLWLPRSR